MGHICAPKQEIVNLTVTPHELIACNAFHIKIVALLTL
jgi:hypothetical protein